MSFFGHFKNHNSRRNIETRQMTPFFSSTFYALFVTFIFIFGNSQNSFSCGVPFGQFWSVKYLNFGQKLPVQPTYHTFLESRHPEVTKNLYYALSPEWSQKKVSATTFTDTFVFFGCQIFVITKLSKITKMSNLWSSNSQKDVIFLREV